MNIINYDIIIFTGPQLVRGSYHGAEAELDLELGGSPEEGRRRRGRVRMRGGVG